MFTKKTTMLIAKLCFCIISIGIISARPAPITVDTGFACPPPCIKSPLGGCFCP